ncbi:ketopantoate reductase family protein [Arthrobacter castelli]|uniref:ketopantoate reductase family protein n=1 Tax=Arthrobacter castelli TaxID=271431 RepID=UPI00041D2883|nr:2-dehydropantoate 2-reductase N-terminal domain-containing protein [Arthrobacter castelli]
MKILVFGAGIIGQIYAARLTAAGCEVSILARGARYDELAGLGIRLNGPDGTETSRPTILGPAEPLTGFDLVIVAVRRDQLKTALPTLETIHAGRFLLLGNAPFGIAQELGRRKKVRTLSAFPGVGGYQMEDGRIRYVEPLSTTVAEAAGDEQAVLELLQSGGFRTATSTQMNVWLQGQAIFITAAAAALSVAGGDPRLLATDRRRLRQLVYAVREGFTSLEQHGGQRIEPRSLRFIFMSIPVPLAALLLGRQLRGDLGTLILGPHARTTRHTETPAIQHDVQATLKGAPPTPTLDQLIAEERRIA